MIIIGLEIIPEQGNEIRRGTSYPPKLLDQYYFHQNLQPKQTPSNINIITLEDWFQICTNKHDTYLENTM